MRLFRQLARYQFMQPLNTQSLREEVGAQLGQPAMSSDELWKKLNGAPSMRLHRWRLTLCSTLAAGKPGTLLASGSALLASFAAGKQAPGQQTAVRPQHPVRRALLRGVAPAAECRNAAQAWLTALGLDSKPPLQLNELTGSAASVPCPVPAAPAAPQRAADAGVATAAHATHTVTRRFADEEVAVLSTSAPAAPASGLDSALRSMEKRKGMTVLDRTRLDWEGAKAAAPKVAEELVTHVRSADTYIGKQAFLARAAEAEAEQERDVRVKRAQRQAH